MKIYFFVQIKENQVLVTRFRQKGSRYLSGYYMTR